MTAKLLVLALALVALATQPFAFDLLPLKRAAFLAATSLLLLLPAFQRALVRTIDGAPRQLVLVPGAFALAAAIAIARNRLGGDEIVVVLRAVLELLLFALAALLARDVAWERGETLVGGVVLLGGLLGAAAIAQVLGFDPIYGEGSPRLPVATFGNGNAFAAFAAPCLAVAAARSARPRAWLAAAAAIALAAALVVARARGAWIAGAAGAIVALLLLRRRSLPWPRTAIVLGTGVLLGLGVDLGAARAGELARKPLGLGLERSSNVVRLDVARATFSLVKLHPLVGCGPGRFRDQYPLVRLEREARTPTREAAPSEVDHPHDEPLRLAAEGGALTAVAALLAVVAAALSFGRAEKATRADDGTTKAALAGGGVAWFAASLTWSTLYDPANALLGALLMGGALAGEVEMAQSRPRERPLALLVTALLLCGSLGLAAPTLLAELDDWRVARDGTRDRGDLEELARAAELDAFNLERQYSIGTLFLQAARLDPATPDLQLSRARDCFERALALVPNHVDSLEAQAEVETRRGDEKAALRRLKRARSLAPWRGDADAALNELLTSLGRELAAARRRLEAEGDAAVAPLLEQAKALRAAGRTRPAAQVLDLIAATRPEDGDLWRELALALKELDDDDGYRRAYRQSQLAFALAALQDGARSEQARTNLALARRCAPDAAGATALEELLEACVDLQRGRIEEARRRLESLDAISARAATAGATPTAKRFLKLLAAQPALKNEVERLGLPR